MLSFLKRLFAPKPDPPVILLGSATLTPATNQPLADSTSAAPAVKPKIPLDLPSVPEQRNEAAEDYFQKGTDLLMAGNFLEAIESYDRALEIKPDLAEAWGNRGLALLNLSRYEEAIESYDRALEIKPDLAEAWGNRGVALLSLSRYEEAIESYDRALAIKPDYSEAWNNRGIALGNLSRYEEAIESYDRALAIKPDYPEAWSNRGNALLNLSRYEEAIESCDRALAIKPELAEAWNNRGVALLNLSRYEEAIESYDRALEIKPDLAEAWGNRGLALGNLSRYEEAIESYDRALAIKPDYPEAWGNRGVALLNLSRYEEAIESYDRAITLQPKLWQAWSSRGSAARPRDPSIKPFIVQILPPSIYHRDLDGRGYEGQLACYREGLKWVTAAEQPEGWGILHHDTGRAHYQFHRFSQNRSAFWAAVEEYKLALTTLTAFPKAHLKVLQDLIRVYNALGDTAAAKVCRQEGLGILRELFNRTTGDSERRQLELEFSFFRQFTVDLLVQEGEMVTALERAELEKNRTLTWILDHWESPEELQGISPSFEQIQGLLHPHRAIVFWHQGVDCLTTFVLCPNHRESPHAFTISTEAWESWLKTWMESYEDYGNKGKGKTKAKANLAAHPWRLSLTTHLDRLRQVLEIERIEAWLKPTAESGDLEIRELLLIPHRDLHRFPLGTLFRLGAEVPETSAKPSAKSCPITIATLPSCRIGLDLQHRPKPESSLPKVQIPLLIVEDPARQDLDPLGFAEVESELISAFFAHPTRNDRLHSSLPEVTAALENPTHQIFHFTGHGEFNSRQPQQSSLALQQSALIDEKNDRLTAAMLQPINLQSYQMVSLAACETALTGQKSLDIEYVGLPSAFLRAGAANVLSTFWTVNDISNAWFMVHFYQMWLADETMDWLTAFLQTQDWLRTVTHQELSAWLQTLASLPHLQPDVIASLQDEIRALPDNAEIPYANPYHWAAFTLAGLPG